jgi:hypothetical protein
VYTILKEAEAARDAAELEARRLWLAKHALKTSLDHHRIQCEELRKGKLETMGKLKNQMELTRLLSAALANRDHVIVDLQAVGPETTAQREMVGKIKSTAFLLARFIDYHGLEWSEVSQQFVAKKVGPDSIDMGPDVPEPPAPAVPRGGGL